MMSVRKTVNTRLLEVIDGETFIAKYNVPRKELVLFSEGV